MADWDKAAETIAQIYALQEECIAMLRGMQADLRAFNARPLPALPPLRAADDLALDVMRLRTELMEATTTIIRQGTRIGELEHRLRKAGIP